MREYEASLSYPTVRLGELPAGSYFHYEDEVWLVLALPSDVAVSSNGVLALPLNASMVEVLTTNMVVIKMEQVPQDESAAKFQAVVP